VLLPQLLPALLTGFALGWARAIGEYGSIAFIAGGMRVADITPHLIIQRLEAFDYAGAKALGTVMLAISLLMLTVINVLQRWAARRAGEAL
jgi:sulfate transport system permease protein